MSYYGQGPGPAVGHFNCIGVRTRLLDCQSEVVDYSHSCTDVGVDCERKCESKDACLVIVRFSLVPRPSGGGERRPATHCMHMR